MEKEDESGTESTELGSGGTYEPGSVKFGTKRDDEGAGAGQSRPVKNIEAIAAESYKPGGTYEPGPSKPGGGGTERGHGKED